MRSHDYGRRCPRWYRLAFLLPVSASWPVMVGVAAFGGHIADSLLWPLAAVTIAGSIVALVPLRSADVAQACGAASRKIASRERPRGG